MNGHLDRRVSASTGRVSYRVVVYVDKAHGGPRYEFPGTFALEHEATAKLVAVLSTYQDGTAQRPSSLTVRALGDRWLRDAVEVDRAPNTVRHHRSNLEHHVYPAFAERLADRVSAAEIATWQADELRSGRRDGRPGGVAVKSLLDYRGTLHAMYAWGVSVGLVRANPVASVPAPRRTRSHPDVPTVAEMRAFLVALESSPRLWWPTFLLAATGMRRGELLATRWRDAELGPAAGRLRIHPDRGNLTGTTRATLRFGPPKTQKGARVVELPEYAVKRLRSYRDEQAARFLAAGLRWTRDVLICCGDEGQPMVPDGYTHELGRFRARHRLARIHPHLLRHAVATAMLEAGTPLEAVAEHLGHSTIVTTADTYNHVRQRVLADAASRYGGLWDGAASGSDGEPSEATQHQTSTKSAPDDELAVRRARKVPA